MFTARDGKQYMTLEESKAKIDKYILQSAEQLIQDLREERKKREKNKDLMYV